MCWACEAEPPDSDPPVEGAIWMQVAAFDGHKAWVQPFGPVMAFVYTPDGRKIPMTRLEAGLIGHG